MTWFCHTLIWKRYFLFSTYYIKLDGFFCLFFKGGQKPSYISLKSEKVSQFKYTDLLFIVSSQQEMQKVVLKKKNKNPISVWDFAVLTYTEKLLEKPYIQVFNTGNSCSLMHFFVCTLHANKSHIFEIKFPVFWFHKKHDCICCIGQKILLFKWQG